MTTRSLHFEVVHSRRQEWIENSINSVSDEMSRLAIRKQLYFISLSAGVGLDSSASVQQLTHLLREQLNWFHRAPILFRTLFVVRFTPSKYVTSEVAYLLSALDSLDAIDLNSNTSFSQDKKELLKQRQSFFTHLPRRSFGVVNSEIMIPDDKLSFVACQNRLASPRSLVVLEDELSNSEESEYISSEWRSASIAYLSRTKFSHSQITLPQSVYLVCNMWQWSYGSEDDVKFTFRHNHTHPINKDETNSQRFHYLDHELHDLLSQQAKNNHHNHHDYHDIDTSSQQLVQEHIRTQPWFVHQMNSQWPQLAIIALPAMCLSKSIFDSLAENLYTQVDFQRHWHELSVFHRAPWLLGSILTKMKRYLLSKILTHHFSIDLVPMILSYELYFDRFLQFEQWGKEILLTPHCIWSDSIKGRLSQL